MDPWLFACQLCGHGREQRLGTLPAGSSEDVTSRPRLRVHRTQCVLVPGWSPPCGYGQSTWAFDPNSGHGPYLSFL